jgi:hypothetical protein
MAKNNKYGVSRKAKVYAEKSMPICRHSPPIASNGKAAKVECTKVQFEVLKLINEKVNFSEIARRRGVNESSSRRARDALIKKRLVNKIHNGVYSVSKLGRELLNNEENKFGMGVGSGPSFPLEKNIHSNIFSVKINKFPKNWEESNFYFQSLKAKDFFMNKSARQLHIYFELCHVRISISKQEATFFIKEHIGSSFDEIESRCFDTFVSHYRTLKGFGFSLDTELKGPRSHFANPNGFFSKLATHCTDKLFRIDLGDISFWIDRSLGPESPEEETDSKDIAQRLEQLSNSAIHTDIDFYDMEQCLRVVQELVKLHTLQAIPQTQAMQEMIPKGGLDYVY